MWCFFSSLTFVSNSPQMVTPWCNFNIDSQLIFFFGDNLKNMWNSKIYQLHDKHQKKLHELENYFRVFEFLACEVHGSEFQLITLKPNFTNN